jgi:hypothetical protein
MTHAADFRRRWTFIARSAAGLELDRYDAASDREAIAYFMKARAIDGSDDVDVYRVDFSGVETLVTNE